jgi:hypothetical protein
VNSFEEAFAAVLAGLAVTCQGESAIRTVGAAFPQLRPVPLEGVEPARVAVAWRNREEVFIVEAGAVTFWIDGSELAAAPETTVYMPRGVPHTFRVDSDGRGDAWCDDARPLREPVPRAWRARAGADAATGRCRPI